MSSNGKTMGISLPSSTGQEAVMRKAYAKAGITNFSDTDYVECHGTGTPVGGKRFQSSIRKNNITMTSSLSYSLSPSQFLTLCRSYRSGRGLEGVHTRQR